MDFLDKMAKLNAKKNGEKQQEKTKVTNENNPNISLSQNDLEQVIEAKTNAKLSKKINSLQNEATKKSKTSDTTRTVVKYDLNLEVGWRIKKQRILFIDLNNYLYSRLINDQEFFNQTIAQIKKEVQ